MTDLKSEIEALLERLQAIERGIQNVRDKQNNTMRDKIYASWHTTIHFATTGLQNTLSLFTVRDAAEKALLGLASSLQQYRCHPLPPIGTYGGVSVSVSDSRILAMDAYLAVCWALYDRLSNIIGSGMANKKIRSKLVETFLDNDILGIKDILVSLCGEEICFSYFLRNCYMHEGGMIDNTPILGGSTWTDAFEITDSVAAKLNQEIGRRHKISDVTIAEQGDIIPQLQGCHARIDEMFIYLLHFMEGTLLVKIGVFAEIDGFRMEE